jgi:RND superfamily putative drug exporter
VQPFRRILEPRKNVRTRGWHRVGTATVRWPGAILVCAIVAALVGLLALPGYHTTYNDRIYLPTDVASNVGYDAAFRHFSQAKMNPDLMMIESDRDLRNPADFLVIDKIAKALKNVHGIAQVQTITRPDGDPIKHSTIAYSVGQSGSAQIMNNDYTQTNLDNLLRQSNDLQASIDSMTEMMSIQTDLAAVAQRMADKMKNTSQDIGDVRDHLADFDDFFRPMRNYFYWDRTAPTSRSAGRWSIFESMDGISTMSDDFEDLVPDMQRMAQLMPKLVAVMPAQIQTMKNQKQTLLNQYQVQKAQQDHAMAMQDNSTAMGEAFDTAKNDDSFYLPPEAFETEDFSAASSCSCRPTVMRCGSPSFTRAIL